MIKHTYLYLTLLFLHNSVTYANNDTLCHANQEIIPARPQLSIPNDDAVHVYADHSVIQDHEGTAVFMGKVVAQKNTQILQADSLFYDSNQDVLKTDGQFTLWDGPLVVSGKKLELHPNQQGKMVDAAYWLMDKRGHGTTETIVQKSKNIIELTNSSYTTCDPNNEVWRLDSRETTLDKAEGTGTSRDVVLRLLDIPVFYTPYISYPIDDRRKSGFLTPHVGTSNEVGTEFSIPYYFNLAPNYDATLTPRFMSRRGLLLKGEFRYLTLASGGTLQAEYLNHDNSFHDKRASLSFLHTGALSERLASDVVFNYVSDNHYFEELGNDLSLSSITHLERRGDLYYYGDGWNLLTRLQAFQTLDNNPAAKPYQRMPQLLLTTRLPERNRRINTNASLEFVRFAHSLDNLVPIGNRWDAQTSISYPWRTPGKFIVPKLSLRYTAYELDHLIPNAQDKISRALFTFSTDAGLFFERDTKLFNIPLLQTLEPRWFYRYTPYKNQNDIPIFDTGLYDLSFYQLFRENRFSGTDRIDDGHQVTTALTTKLLEQDSGIERLRLSIGQTYYFRDRRVNLPQQEPEDEQSSSIIAEVASQFTPAWNAAVTTRWNPHSHTTEQSVVRFRYRTDSEHIFNASYRLREEKLEQTDFSGYWPLGKRWHIVGRWNYSLQHHKDLEIFSGLEYESCCWAIRGVVRRYLNNVEGDYMNGFFIEFQLKGLMGIGKKADTFLGERIFGYDDKF